MELKDRIREQRLRCRLTTLEVAQKIGVRKQTISKYEQGIVTNIPSNRLEALAKALNTTPGYLMGWEDVDKIEEATDAIEMIKEALNQSGYFERDFTDEEVNTRSQVLGYI